MNTESHHKSLKYLSRHAKPENLPLVMKIIRDLRYTFGKKHVRQTGVMHSNLSRYLHQRFVEHEGNQGY